MKAVKILLLSTLLGFSIFSVISFLCCSFVWVVVLLQPYLNFCFYASVSILATWIGFISGLMFGFLE